MKSFTPNKTVSASNSSKTKKPGKDREKKKSQNTSDSNSQNLEKSVPIKGTGHGKYAGLGAESLRIYNEQTTFEQLSDDVCAGFTEDVNYKLRQIIHEAFIKAKLSGRDHINSEDIDDVFECLNIERVYGAPKASNWLTLGDSNLIYLDDTKINLIEISEQECTAVQPGGVVSINRWYNNSSLDFTEAQKKYYVTLCNSVIDNCQNIREAALKDLRNNTKIGPLCEWFYQFGYILLSKHLMYNSLTVYALGFIEALENNPIALQSVSEVRLELLAKLLLQRVLQPSSVEIVRPLCKLLTILCHRIPLYNLVKAKVKKKFYKIKSGCAFQVVHLINSLGVDAIKEILLPNIDYFFNKFEYKDTEVTGELLGSYNILCCEKLNSKEIDTQFFEYFGESVITCRRFDENLNKDCRSMEMNWSVVKRQLLKSRRYLSVEDDFLNRRYYRFNDVFPENEEEPKREIFEFEVREMMIIEQKNQELDINFKPKFKFRFDNFNPSEGRSRFLKMAPQIDFTKRTNNNRKCAAVVGRINLLTPVLKKSSLYYDKTNCFTYNINNYVL